MVTPGQALVALRAELAGRGITVTAMTITRLDGTLILPGGAVVRFRHGWLMWPTGRASRRGSPTVHPAHRD